MFGEECEQAGEGIAGDLVGEPLVILEIESVHAASVPREMDDLRFVIEQRTPQFVSRQGPLHDEPELVPVLGPLQALLDLLGFFVESEGLGPLRIRRQEEDRRF